MHLPASSPSPELGSGGLAKLVSSGASAPPNDQTQEVSAVRLERWLGQLEARSPVGTMGKLTNNPGSVHSIFTARRLHAVADALSRELARATSRQDVALRLEQYRKAFVGVQRSPRVTALRAFVRNGQLNLIFGTLGQNPNRIRPGHTVTVGVAAPSPRLDRAAKYKQEIGSRTDVGKGPDELILPPFARQRTASRPDWIVINLASQSSSRMPATREAPSRRPTEPLQPMAPAHSSAILKSKLQTLKQLHDQHLIDDSLYQTEKKELIQRYLNEVVQ